jgi:hypothetical protein
MFKLKMGLNLIRQDWTYHPSQLLAILAVCIRIYDFIFPSISIYRFFDTCSAVSSYPSFPFEIT